MTQPLLEIAGLSVSIGGIEIVRGLDLQVAPGEAVGLVGESGSGKSMTALAVMRLLPPGARISGGDIRFQGDPLPALPESEIEAVRGRDIAMIFQDPLTALNPALTIGRQLVDALRAHQRLGRRAAQDRVTELLGLVGIASPRRLLTAYPHEFSGGMRQRALIAMAVACQPKLLIADEPTTALDVTVQAQVMDLLARLQDQLALGMLFISHNLDLVAEICDRVVVMYAGRAAESGATATLFDAPRHPYTRQLLRCIPRLTDEAGELPSICGAPPQAGKWPLGCAFAPRCDRASDACAAQPPLRSNGRQQVACWAASP